MRASLSRFDVCCEMQELANEFQNGTSLAPGASTEHVYHVLASKVKLMFRDSKVTTPRWEEARDGLDFGNSSKVPFYPLYSAIATFDGEVAEGIELYNNTRDQVKKTAKAWDISLVSIKETGLLAGQMYQSGCVRREVETTK